MMNPEVTPLPEAQEHHRQEVRRWVIYPVAGGLILVVLLVLSTVFLTPRGLGTVANFLLSCFCLLPMVVCLFPLYMAVMSAIYGMNWLTNFSLKNLEKARELTVSLEQGASDATDRISRQAIDVSAALARLDPILDFFNRYPKSRSQGDLPNVK